MRKHEKHALGGVQPETMLETIDRELVEAERGPVSVRHRRSAPQAVAEVLAGAAAGAALGAMAGALVGAVVGAVIGGLVGAAADVMLERDQSRAAQRDAELDADIGVVGGHIGDAAPNQPPTRIGAFSSASMGAYAPRPTPSEGPIQNVDTL